MKKEVKTTTKGRSNPNNVQSESENLGNKKDNIKDYSRAWEDDRL
nr:hypothetical protein [Neobacillus sp. Marseille-Q6967]